jgi:hypothetical protein
MRRTLAALVALVLIAGCGGSEHGLTKKTPAPGSDFMGIYADDVFFGDAGYRREALAQQHDAGIRLIRQPFGWADFVRDPQRFDDFVGAAADAGIRVLPVLVGSKSAGGMKPPADPARFAGWAALLARRYGPAGSFWKGRAKKLPITSWQVWNEPNIKAWWAPKPDPAAYAALLRQTAEAIR